MRTSRNPAGRQATRNRLTGPERTLLLVPADLFDNLVVLNAVNFLLHPTELVGAGIRMTARQLSRQTVGHVFERLSVIFG